MPELGSEQARAQLNRSTEHMIREALVHDHFELFVQPIVDLGSYDSVCANVRTLELAFGLPIDDPNSMPVTRDLSPTRRKAILRWLREPGPDGKPRKGTPPPARAPRCRRRRSR